MADDDAGAAGSGGDFDASQEPPPQPPKSRRKSGKSGKSGRPGKSNWHNKKRSLEAKQDAASDVAGPKKSGRMVQQATRLEESEDDLRQPKTFRTMEVQTDDSETEWIYYPVGTVPPEPAEDSEHDSGEKVCWSVFCALNSEVSWMRKFWASGHLNPQQWGWKETKQMRWCFAQSQSVAFGFTVQYMLIHLGFWNVVVRLAYTHTNTSYTFIDTSHTFSTDATHPQS